MPIFSSKLSQFTNGSYHYLRLHQWNCITASWRRGAYCYKPNEKLDNLDWLRNFWLFIHIDQNILKCYLLELFYLYLLVIHFVMGKAKIKKQKKQNRSMLVLFLHCVSVEIESEKWDKLKWWYWASVIVWQALRAVLIDMESQNLQQSL